MSTARVPAGSRRSPRSLIAAVLLALCGSAPAQEAPPTQLPLRGVVLLTQAPLQTSTLSVELPQGVSLGLKARGAAAAPELELLGTDGAPLPLEPVARGRMTSLRGFVAPSTGTYTLRLTDTGTGGALVLSSRTTWPRRTRIPMAGGAADLTLLSPGPEVPVTLVVRAPKGSLDGGLALLGLTGPGGSPLTVPDQALRLAAGGRVLRLGPVSLPGGVSHALVGGTPVPGTPLPDLEARQGMRFSRSSRLR